MSFDSVLRWRGWVVFAILFAAAVVGFGAPALRAIAPDHLLPPAAIGVAIALMEFLYFGWALAVGAAMNSRLPGNLRRGSLLPAIGLVIATGYMYWFARQFASPFGPPSFGSSSFGPVLIALHFFSMVVNLYLLWYVSRALVAAEEGGKPAVDRILGLFFALWFSMILPVGAWWAQERARVVESAP